MTTERDDVMRQTVEHVRRVGLNMSIACNNLMIRAVNHDASKFSAEEFETFARVTPRLRGMTYGSEEYQASLDELGPALNLMRSIEQNAERFGYDKRIVDVLKRTAREMGW